MLYSDDIDKSLHGYGKLFTSDVDCLNTLENMEGQTQEGIYKNGYYLGHKFNVDIQNVE